MATTDRMAFRYAIEDSYGELESGGTALQDLLITSETLTDELNIIESEVVLGDRQIHDLIRVGQVCRRNIVTELRHENLDDLLQGALAASWVSDTLENGSSKLSYAFEKHMQDIAQFFAFRGCRLGGIDLDFALQRIISATIPVLGRGGVFAGSTIGTGSPTEAPDNPPITTLSSLSIEEGGAGVEVATRFTVNIANNLREQRVLGMTDLRDINLGLFRVRGTMEAYFEDRTYVDKLVAGTPSDFEIVAQDENSNAYVFTFPRFEFTRVTGPNNTGRSRDVMTTLEWTALRDPSAAYTLRIER
jgi:hypothetical protein